MYLQDFQSNKSTKKNIYIYVTQAPKPFMTKNPLLWTGTQATCKKIQLSDIPNRVNYCVIL